MLLATALLIVGFTFWSFTVPTAWFFAASILCRTFGIPPLIIGMTVVSIGTSLPEIIVSLAASLHEQRDLAVSSSPRLKHYQYIADPRSGCAGSSFYRPF